MLGLYQHFVHAVENSMEPLPIEVDADCVDIVNDESFVPVKSSLQRWPACF